VGKLEHRSNSDLVGLPSIEEARKNVPNSYRKHLEAIWDESIGQNNKSATYQFSLGSPSPELVSEISRILGRPVNSRKHIIELGYVRHIKKRHGENGAAIEGNVPITKELFALISDILKNFDSVATGHRTRGEEAVLIKRHYSDGTGIIVEAVPVKDNLEIRSFRIERIK
jgi:hypothetical protein